MTPEHKVLLASSFRKSRFNYCPLIWMFYSMNALRRLKNVDERSLRFKYQDYVSNYITLPLNVNRKVNTSKTSRVSYNRDL